jgi:hypothetical protein
VIEALRGIRDITVVEARSIAISIRKYCPGWFELQEGRDALVPALKNGQRYRRLCAHPKDPVGAEEAERKRKLKEVYLVNKVKFHSLVTVDELRLKIDFDEIPPGYTKDDMHRILHCKLR